MGALHRQVGAHDRHENFRRVGTAKRIAEKVWLRAGPSGDGCKGIAGQELNMINQNHQHHSGGRGMGHGSTASYLRRFWVVTALLVPLALTNEPVARFL